MSDKPTIGQAPGKREEVRAMFDSIAHRYDLLNHLLSLGIDRLWRKKAVSMLKSERPRRILDVATGTADLAIEALRLNPERIVGIDISEKMLEKGRVKVANLGKAGIIDLRQGASENLPLDDNSFDAALVAFGVRNFENLRGGLEEIARVLAPGRPLVVLEFSHPSRFPVKQVYDFYFRHVVPHIGKAVSKNATAYQYLPESVNAFPHGRSFLDEMEASGFTDLRQESLTFGIAALYFGRSGRERTI
ncbi:MAG: bifunctional demethylmenaquinone methyltransferase/2-methoxy-6-polyprenyl-1,4-benzoquinol methylase UbiE [Rhodothermia bacterium]